MVVLCTGGLGLVPIILRKLGVDCDLTVTDYDADVLNACFHNLEVNLGGSQNGSQVDTIRLRRFDFCSEDDACPVYAIDHGLELPAKLRNAADSTDNVRSRDRYDWIEGERGLGDVLLAADVVFDEAVTDGLIKKLLWLLRCRACSVSKVANTTGADAHARSLLLRVAREHACNTNTQCVHTRQDGAGHRIKRELFMTLEKR